MPNPDFMHLLCGHNVYITTTENPGKPESYKVVGYDGRFFWVEPDGDSVNEKMINIDCIICIGFTRGEVVYQRK